MLRVRIVAVTPQEAESVSAQLAACGFDVEVVTPDFPSETHADFELHLQRSTVRQSVMRTAAETVPEMVMVAPGLLARREIATPKIPPRRVAAIEQQELAATGTCAETRLAPVAVMVTHSGGETQAVRAQETVPAEAGFATALRRAQFEAMRGFAAPTERVRQGLLSRLQDPAARLVRALTLARGRTASLAAALLGYFSSR
jgi:hypothetical protein